MSTMRNTERKIGEATADAKQGVERATEKASETLESAKQYTSDAMDSAMETAGMAKDRAMEMAEDFQTQLTRMINDRPLTTLAIGAGLAFALGALWKVSSPRQPAWYEMDRWRR